MNPIQGKVALVTGGSRGIGAAVAERLARDGADVALTYNSSADQAKEVLARVEQAGRRGSILKADASAAEDVTAAVERTVAELGRIDILVNNAGIFLLGQIDELTLADYDTTMAVHNRAVFVATQAAVRHMESGGRIINIGSNLAERASFAGLSLYSMSKSALVGFTKGLSRDVGPRGITANVVHPGSTDTDMNPADGGAADGQRALTALGRYGEPGDIAATVAHLAGPGGAQITGTEITVDGGATA
ncbi:NAD(P)-dependent dehydrogenase (short-subunit alcohol dehydrogenase family) [Haloactinospora alba]|uniref:NAD(P)-dependent dehydrogenase (Short-subunit alcohol dehydrogenase family) n=1 Tax=Haloactinospora alba TaxID=405555 RepID=A0A543N9Y5_9ACTN|nr:3-oxoacyl-ACP reductase family protein [Haloactinospora alba]TQN28630.1 NAD(P)-dependent dehydrogenase (short-subunit alcohol dehydrogenase family) [Haloactinospora alba]